MTIHDIRHKLTLLNKRILYAREVCTQPAVIQELDGLICDICSLGDHLEDRLDGKK